MTTASDLELAARACLGDERAMDALVSRALPVVRGLARRLTRCPEDGDALAQEAIVSALETLERYRGEAAFSTWVCGIALRRQAEEARRVAMERRGLPNVPRPSPPNPAELTEARDVTRRLWDLVVHLPPIHRNTIATRATSETGAEAARRLGLTPEAFRVRLHRARGALRDLMAREHPDLFQEMCHAER